MIEPLVADQIINLRKENMSEEKETIEWDFMDEDEAIFVRKVISLLHSYYKDDPPDYIIMAVWLLRKRLEEIDGPQINELKNWEGNIN